MQSPFSTAKDYEVHSSEGNQNPPTPLPVDIADGMAGPAALENRQFYKHFHAVQKFSFKIHSWVYIQEK